MRSALEVLADVLEHVEEWHYEDNGRERNVCWSCGVDGNRSDPRMTHAPGCKLKALLDEAEVLLENQSDPH